MAEVEEEVPPAGEEGEEVAAEGGALVVDEEDFVAAGGATEVKLFGKWSFDDIEIRDISLVVSCKKNLMLEKEHLCDYWLAGQYAATTSYYSKILLL